MKLSLEINNLAKSPVKKPEILRVAENTLKIACSNRITTKNMHISLALVDEKTIKSLNRRYRGKNSSTDVLSFAEYKDFLKSNPEDKDVFLGEVVLCYNDIKQYAKKQKLNFKKEFSKAISHGILHLLGFKHGQKMFQIQEEA